MQVSFKNIIVVLSIVCSAPFCKAQEINSKQLTNDEINILFDASTKSALQILMPIIRVYEYKDKSGTYYCVFTESNDIDNGSNNKNSKIKAINFLSKDNTLTKNWEINDIIIPNSYEKRIWFWSKYFAFEDYDEDGLIEPIITYGTAGMNGYDDGRIKFICYYNGKKYAIRHQNGVLDSERETHIDASIYTLPTEMQAAIRKIMVAMINNNHAIFPHGWEKRMQQRKTRINER